MNQISHFKFNLTILFLVMDLCELVWTCISYYRISIGFNVKWHYITLYIYIWIYNEKHGMVRNYTELCKPYGIILNYIHPNELYGILRNYTELNWFVWNCKQTFDMLWTYIESYGIILELYGNICNYSDLYMSCMEL